jgi:ankyrin repeat protein
MVGINDNDMNIWIASSDGNLDLVQQYLTTLSVDSKDENGYTPIHAAASYGHYQLTLFLIDSKANINIQDSDGDTPLHVCQSLDVVKLLVERGSDPTIRNFEEKLPIEIAYIEGAMDVVEYLQQFTPEYHQYEQEDPDQQLESLLRELESQGIQVSNVAEELDSDNELER